jgi:hypothetical protein
MKSLADLVRAGGAFALFDGDRTLRLAGRSLKQFLEYSDAARSPDSYRISELLNILGIAQGIAGEIEGGSLPHQVIAPDASGLVLEIVATPVARGHFTFSVTAARSAGASETPGGTAHEDLKNSTLIALSQAIAHDVNNSLGVILGFTSLSADEIRKVATMLPQGPAANQLNAIAAQLSTVVTSSEAAIGSIAQLVALVDTRASAPRR